MIRSVILRPRLACTRFAYNRTSSLAFSSRSPVAAAKGSPNPLTFAFASNEEDDEQEYRPKNPKKPNLVGLPKQWDKLDMATQEGIIEYLEDRMRGDWKLLTDDERKALWFIYYGPWGSRSVVADDPGKVYKSFAKFILLVMVGVTGYKAYENNTSKSES